MQGTRSFQQGKWHRASMDPFGSQSQQTRNAERISNQQAEIQLALAVNLRWICFPEVVDLCRRSSPQLQSQMQESLRSLLVPISVSTESILTCKVFWCFTHAKKQKVLLEFAPAEWSVVSYEITNYIANYRQTWSLKKTWTWWQQQNIWSLKLNNLNLAAAAEEEVQELTGKL